MAELNEPEQTYHEENAICPYCGNAYHVEAEDYDLDGVEEECEQCGGVYERITEIEVTHYCTPKKAN